MAVYVQITKIFESQSTGLVVPFGSVAVYTRGTTTPVALYTDATARTTTPNPTTITNGVVSAFVAEGSWDLVPNVSGITYSPYAFEAVSGANLRLLQSTLYTGASPYTFQLLDAGTIVEISNAGAINVIVPPNASVAFPLGALLEVYQAGAGQVTIVAGTGVTLRSDANKVKTTGQYATIGLRQRVIDEWVISGDLA